MPSRLTDEPMSLPLYFKTTAPLLTYPRPALLKKDFNTFCFYCVFFIFHQAPSSGFYLSLATSATGTSTSNVIFPPVPQVQRPHLRRRCNLASAAILNRTRRFSLPISCVVFEILLHPYSPPFAESPYRDNAELAFSLLMKLSYDRFVFRWRGINAGGDTKRPCPPYPGPYHLFTLRQPKVFFPWVKSLLPFLA